MEKKIVPQYSISREYKNLSFGLPRKKLYHFYMSPNSKKFTLYVDESGTAGLSDKRSEYFILTGLAIEHPRDNELSGWFDVLKRKYGINKGHTFHSVDIFELKDSLNYLTNKNDRALADSLGEFIALAPIKYKVVALKKSVLRKALRLPRNLIPNQFRRTAVGVQVRDIGYDILSGHLFFWFSNKVLKNDSYRGSISC
ncbi:MAG: DUF3800 domain-containing protein [bacterium]|nr:DUF3800 domain-containing protein [bacterium]